MKKENLENFIKISTEEKLTEKEFKELVDACMEIYENLKSYEIKFWNENYNEEENYDSQEFRIIDYFGVFSLVLYEMDSAGLSYNPIAWGEDMEMIHTELLRILERYNLSQLPNDTNFDAYEYIEFLKSEIQNKEVDYVIYFLSDTMPPSEGLIFLPIKKKYVEEFERLKKELNIDAENILENNPFDFS